MVFGQLVISLRSHLKVIPSLSDNTRKYFQGRFPCSATYRCYILKEVIQRFCIFNKSLRNKLFAACAGKNRRAGFETLWKSLENSIFFHFLGKVWKRLETSGFGMILNFLLWKSLENAFSLKLKILILRKSCSSTFNTRFILIISII